MKFSDSYSFESVQFRSLDQKNDINDNNFLQIKFHCKLSKNRTSKQSLYSGGTNNSIPYSTKMNPLRLEWNTPHVNYLINSNAVPHCSSILIIFIDVENIFTKNIPSLKKHWYLIKLMFLLCRIPYSVFQKFYIQNWFSWILNILYLFYSFLTQNCGPFHQINFIRWPSKFCPKF